MIETIPRPVSIVCVFNDPGVRQMCLDASIERHRHEAKDVDYIPVDNVDGSFASAGEALNFGAAQARHDVVAFVHQDVVLHSLDGLQRAAGMLLDDDFAVLGAIGVTSQGRYRGRIRDRVVLLGQSAPRPVEVESVDEVLFLIARDVLDEEPISTDPDLAWHGYAVEYGMRSIRRGRRVGAVDIPLTHNSLTTNLDRLNEAHERLAEMYPDILPIRTTCGTVRRRSDMPRSWPAVDRHRWRYRWMKQSLTAARLMGHLRGARIVLSDIRLDVDAVVRSVGGTLEIVNLDAAGTLGDGELSQVELVRATGSVFVRSVRPNELRDEVVRRDRAFPLLCTDLTVADILALSDVFSDRGVLLGVHEDAGLWVLLGHEECRIKEWESPRARPLRLRPGLRHT